MNHLQIEFHAGVNLSSGDKNFSFDG